MNKYNAKDFLPLVQALAEGRIVQYRWTSGEWKDGEHLSFECEPGRYRIKPEPREIWLNRHIDGRNSNTAYTSKEHAEAGICDGWTAVRYREVIE